jgi:UDP-N-acetylmuramoyl-tripeptide--D-alanyl-D-alanine ligase
VQAPGGRSESELVADADAAIDWLRRELRPGDVVLFKASNAVQLSRVAQALLEDPRVEEGSR